MASSQEGLLTGPSPSLLCHKADPGQLQCAGWEGSELVIVRPSKVTIGLGVHEERLESGSDGEHSSLHPDGM